MEAAVLSGQPVRTPPTPTTAIPAVPRTPPRAAARARTTWTSRIALTTARQPHLRHSRYRRRTKRQPPQAWPPSTRYSSCAAVRAKAITQSQGTEDPVYVIDRF